MIFLFLVTVDIPCGGITVFFTQLIGGMGFDSNTTFLITMPAGVVQVVCNLGIPYIAQFTGRRMLSAVGAMCLSLFGISLMAGLSRDGPTAHTIGQMIGYYITIGNSATATILVLSSVSSNAAGHTKKTTVNAIALVGYCIGESTLAIPWRKDADGATCRLSHRTSDLPGWAGVHKREDQHHCAVVRGAVLLSVAAFGEQARERPERQTCRVPTAAAFRPGVPGPD